MNKSSNKRLFLLPLLLPALLLTACSSAYYETMETFGFEKRDLLVDRVEDARGRYSQLMAAMRRAEATMDPVLEAFEDQVLVLKHNLNAQAIGALRGELASIERNTDRLVAEMQQSIAEADAFIASMK